MLKEAGSLRQLQKIFEVNSGIEYFNLYKIAEQGFNIPLVDFLEGHNSTDFTLEELIEQFDVIDFNAQVSTQEGTIVKTYLGHLRSRVSILLETLANHTNATRIKKLTGIDIKVGFTANWITLRALLRIAHLFDISLSHLLGHEDISSLQPVRLNNLPEASLQESLNTLSQNIQRDMDALNLSLVDLTARINSVNVRSRYLEVILNRHTNATYYRLAQICKGLLQPAEDIFAPMQRLLEGV